MSKNLKNSKIPFLSIGQENLMLLTDMLEKDEIGEMMIAIYQYVYEDVEPEFNTKAMKSVWNNLMATMERKASSYFGRKEHMEKINDKKKNTNKETNISNKEETTIVIPTEFDIKPLPAYAEVRSIPTVKIVTDEEKYGPEIMDFLEEYGKEIYTALKSAVDYFYFKEDDKKMLAEEANKKIDELATAGGLKEKNLIGKLEQYCADFRDEYIKTKNNQIIE